MFQISPIVLTHQNLKNAQYEARTIRITESNGTAVSSIEAMMCATMIYDDHQAEYAGLRNQASLMGIDGHQKVSVEELLTWQPDIIVLPCETSNCEAVVTDFKAKPLMKNLDISDN